MAGARSTAETLASCTASASAGQMQRQRQRLMVERVATVPALVCKPSDRRLDRSLEFSARHADPIPVTEFDFRTLLPDVERVKDLEQADEVERKPKQKPKKVLLKPPRIKVKNAALKRLLSGALAGTISRTAVAPLETIRTHLMVGNAGRSVTAVFHHIIEGEGWKGLFRGNGINVLRVAPSKAIELFVYDTVKRHLTTKPGERSQIPVPISTIAGATAGVCSTLCTYPLELLKTRLTIQRGVYDNLLHALVKICKEEGPGELYRGLTPSLIGVIPYAATNYFAYDTLRKAYQKFTKQEKVGNLATLCIGSASAAISSATTFPLEMARKQMQVGAVGGRVPYRNLLHALTSILEQQGPAGLYRGLAASCFKLIPAAGISFMCYEGMKQILLENEESQQP